MVVIIGHAPNQRRQRQMGDSVWVTVPRVPERRTSVRDEPRADDLADERRQIGRHGVHALVQVRLELLAVRRERDDAIRKELDVGEVDV